MKICDRCGRLTRHYQQLGSMLLGKKAPILCGPCLMSWNIHYKESGLKDFDGEKTEFNKIWKRIFKEWMINLEEAKVMFD